MLASVQRLTLTPEPLCCCTHVMAALSPIAAGSIPTKRTPAAATLVTPCCCRLPRGCHLITRHIYDALPEISSYEVGLANLFLLHTSASLTINENASPDVLLDLNVSTRGCA